MSKIIPIITSAPIQYSFDGLDMYDAFDLVSKGLKDAPLTENAIDILKNHQFNFDLKKIDTIFTAEKGQTVATAELFIKLGLTPNAKIIPTQLLNGIRFSMQDLVSKERFLSLPQDKALSLARKIFITKLYENNLEESLEDLQKRMDSLIYLLKQNKKEIFCISHAFYMKLFEIYLKDREAFDKLETLQRAFNPNQKPYEPLSGFDCEI